MHTDTRGPARPASITDIGKPTLGSPGLRARCTPKVRDHGIWSGNPLHFQCAGPESALGRVKRVATHCHGATVLRRVLQRLSLHYALRWRRRELERRFVL